MVVRRKKKVRKYRGSVLHGAGSRKKRRGAGSRGGRGRAGSGKRAGHKKQLFSIGSRGFVPRRENPTHVHQGKALGLGYFTAERLQRLLQEGKITKKDTTYYIDLQALGYHKLLGTGRVQEKLLITAGVWSPSAEEKVKAVGGEIVIREKKRSGPEGKQKEEQKEEQKERS